MKKNRTVVGAVLAAGLSLGGLVAASPSGAATPQPTRASSTGAHHWPVVCVIETGPVKGKPGKVPGKVFPGKVFPGGKPVLKGVKGVKGKPGEVCPLPPGKGGPVCVIVVDRAKGEPGKVPGKDVKRKVVINGKAVKDLKGVKGKPGAVCPLPPGKGRGGPVCVIVVDPAPGKPGKGLPGKVVINGKPVAKGVKGKPGAGCPLPPLKGKGGITKGGVIVGGVPGARESGVSSARG